MTGIRKQKRKKRFRASVNRKRLRNKAHQLPKIECKEIQDSWEFRKSMRNNLNEMGLAYDPNEVLEIPNLSRNLLGTDKRSSRVKPEETKELITNKIHVADKLEVYAKQPRPRMLRLPNNQVRFITYLMDKYNDDYKAMARDRQNYYQMTWQQIRAKINTFKGIPAQYTQYLRKKGDIVSNDPTSMEETPKKLRNENSEKDCIAKKKKSINPTLELEHENDGSQSNDNDSDEELENDNFSDASDAEPSEDDISHDGKFVMDSNHESD